MVVVAYVALVLIVAWVVARHAPEGYEDKEGFHRGRGGEE